MIVVGIILGVAFLLAVVSCAANGQTSSEHPASSTNHISNEVKPKQRQTIAEFVANGGSDSGTSIPVQPKPSSPIRPQQTPTLSEVPQKPIDRHIDPGLVVQARDNGLDRFPVLGACSVRGYVADVLVAGTVLSVRLVDNYVLVIRGDGVTIGTFPPAVAKAYVQSPLNARYTQVVVASDVNLNDKYGRCFVYPVLMSKC